LPNYYAFWVYIGVGTCYFNDFDPNIPQGDLKMKISKQKLQQILKEELELANMTLPNGEIDHEGRMAKRQLQDIAEYSAELSEMLQDDTQLESWVQAKITKAADYISKVKHYLEYEMKSGKHDQITSQMPQMDDIMSKMPPQIDDSYEF